MSAEPSAPDRATPGVPPRLALRNISKQYPAVKANDHISLVVQPGEIHALLGENGAGKSTLMKIVFGAVQPDEGEIEVDGQRVRIDSPHDARQHGIAMVFQHFSLFDTLSAAENVWLGLESRETLAQVTERMQRKAAEYGLQVDASRPVYSLSVGERQRVEIVRALLSEPRLLILDEPTSVLTPAAVQSLFETLRLLAAQGCSILYISHKLDEIRVLCHHCTVLRGGRVTGAVDPRHQSNAELSTLMIGAEPPALVHRAIPPGAVALEVEGLGLAPESIHGVALEGVRLALRAGEVLGIAGVSGNGQQELLAALSGEDRRAAPGSIRLFGRDMARAGPAQRRRNGLHFVPEERLGRGAVPSHSLAANTLLTRRRAVRAFGWIDVRATRALAADLIERFRIKAGGPDALAKSLSGGNLQKFLVAREIDAEPKVLIVAQPTWGVDVGAAAQIRGALLALRDAGCAVLVVSEELDELFELCDRMVVIARGRLSPSVPAREATVEQIGQWMAGIFDAPAPRVDGAD